MTLQDVIQVSDGNQIESYVIGTGGLYTYRLGDNASPVLPTGWVRTVKGAVALPAPSAPSLGVEVPDADALANAAAYKWAMSAVTPNGESLLSSQATHTMTQAAGQTLTMPLVTSTADNRVTARRLYRSRAGGTNLFRVLEAPGPSAITLVDTMPDNHLILPAPVADTSAAASGIISVTGTIAGTPTTFVETLATNPSTGQYNINRATGVMKFAVADNGVTVTITYVAASRVEKTLLNDMIQELLDVSTPGYDGFSDGGSSRAGVVCPSATWTQMPTFGGGFTSRGGRVICFASFIYTIVGGTVGDIYFSCTVNGVTLGSGTWGQARSTGTTGRVTLMGISDPISGAVTHNIIINPTNNNTIDFLGINHGAWELPA